jgi:hypothetical protein
MPAPTGLRSALRGWWLVSLAALAGCGRDAGGDRPAVASAPDTPPAAGKPSAEATPPTPAAPDATQPAAPQPVKPKGSATPLSAREVARVIDLRTFPRMDGAKLEASTLGPLAAVTYQAPGDVQKALDFHVKKLTDAGWQEHYTGEKRHIHKEGKSEYAMITATKQDFILSVHMEGEAGKDEVRVSVFSNGNFDTRTLPRTKDGELIGDSGTFPNYSHTIYTTAGTVEATEEFTRKELTAAGWQEFSDRLTDNSRVPGSLTLRNRAVRLGVYISKAEALGGKTSVQYSASVLSDDVPTTADAADVRVQDDHEAFQLRFETGSSVQQVTDFYKKELPALGWKFREGAGLVKADAAFLFFDAENKDRLVIDLSRKTAKTLVKVVHLPPDAKKDKPDPTAPPKGK